MDSVNKTSGRKRKNFLCMAKAALLFIDKHMPLMKSRVTTEGFRRFWLNISETVPQIFTKLMSLLSGHIQMFLKLKDWG